MEIHVFGSGCAKCTAMEHAVSSVVQEMGLDARVHKISDLKAMMAAGVMSIPALSIDGTVVCTGRVPSNAEIRDWLSGGAATALKDGSCGCSCGGSC